MRIESLAQSSKRWKIALWVLVAGIYALICYLSFQTGEETTELSQSIALFLEYWIGISALQAAALARGMRTIAHFAEFATLTMALYIAIRATAPDNRWLWGIALLLCMALAVFSEAFKVFIPGRHLDVGEMIFNVIGCILGLVLGICLRWCWHAIQRGLSKGEETMRGDGGSAPKPPLKGQAP